MQRKLGWMVGLAGRDNEDSETDMQSLKYQRTLGRMSYSSWSLSFFICDG